MSGMRIRQIKPSFFKDARMAELSAAVRLFYVGLWMLADDAGYLRWDVDEAALELYGYESRGRRERAVKDHLAVLIAAKRVVDLKCGHLSLPTLTVHQRFAGATKRVLTYEREHLKCAPPRLPAGIADVPPMPAPVSGVAGSEPVREGSERHTSASATEEIDGFKDRVGWRG